MNRHERRLARFFALLAAVIILTIAHGFISGEIEMQWHPDCGEDDCQQDQ